MGPGFPASSTTRASGAVGGSGCLSPGGDGAAREGEEMEGATPVFEPLVRHELRMTYAHQYAHFSSSFRGVAPSTEIPGGKAIGPAKRPALGQRNQAGQQQCQWESKMAGFWAPKVSGSERCPTEGADRPEWGSGPGVRSSWQSLGRCWRSAVHSVRKGMDRFGEFLVPTHAVAVASDVDDVARGVS